MRLLKISYKDFNWELKDLELDSVNLIVAKNSTGKSRTLAIIDFLIKIITQKSNNLNRDARWVAEFVSSNAEHIQYYVSTTFDEQSKKSSIEDEKLIVNGKIVLDRGSDGAWLLNILGNTTDAVYPPQDKLVLHTNRDIKKYPFLEDIIGWAENSFGFRFANIIPHSTLNATFFELLNKVEDIPNLYHTLNDDSRRSVMNAFNSIGYSISEITSQEKTGTIDLLIKEKDIDRVLTHTLLAQGMYRALSIIIFIQYLKSTKQPAMINIDDFCEGLDYERAKKLGKLVFNECLESNIQLIATSNDIFLMEVIDIKYWNVLQRKGNIVTTINIKNSPKMFSDFRFTGLSNFDFFSSDFLKQESA